jgi:hypothetical protein
MYKMFLIPPVSNVPVKLYNRYQYLGTTETTKHIFLPHFCQKLYVFSSWTDFPWWPSWISVTKQRLKCFWHHHCIRHTRKHQNRHQYYRSTMFLSIVICIYVLPFTWRRPFWKMAVFLGSAANFGIFPCRLLKLRVSHTQINCQTPYLQKCIWASMPGSVLSLMFCHFWN